MSADPIYDGVKQGLGVFTYCANNPLIYKDPTGLKTWDPNKGDWNNYVKDQPTAKNYEKGKQNNANQSTQGRKGEGSDKQFKNQLSDINETEDGFCVYTTDFNAYSEMFNQDKGYYPSTEDAKKVKEIATTSKIPGTNLFIVEPESGWVNSYEELAKVFNSYFNTDYKYSYSSTESSAVPSTLSPDISKDAVIMPFVRILHNNVQHTSNYLGNNKIHDVFDDKVEDITNTTIYKYGTHTYSK